MPRVCCYRCRRGLSPRLTPRLLPRILSCRCGTQILFTLRASGKIGGKKLITDEDKAAAWTLVRAARAAYVAAHPQEGSPDGRE